MSIEVITSDGFTHRWREVANLVVADRYRTDCGPTSDTEQTMVDDWPEALRDAAAVLEGDPGAKIDDRADVLQQRLDSIISAREHIRSTDITARVGSWCDGSGRLLADDAWMNCPGCDRCKPGDKETRAAMLSGLQRRGRTFMVEAPTSEDVHRIKAAIEEEEPAACFQDVLGAAWTVVAESRSSANEARRTRPADLRGHTSLLAAVEHGATGSGPGGDLCRELLAMPKVSRPRRIRNPKTEYEAQCCYVLGLYLILSSP